MSIPCRRALLAVVAAAALNALATAPATAASTSRSCLPSSLKSTLAQIEKRFGSVHIVSTHRPGATINGSGRPSYHASCRAVDFVPASGKSGAVISWLQDNHDGGLGTYGCGLHHIHIDDGPNIRFRGC